MPELLPSPDRSRVGKGRCPGFRGILRKILCWDGLASIDGQEVPCKDAICARDSVGLIEPESDGVGAADHRAVGQRESDRERGETSANAAEAPTGLGDRDRVIVERNPRAHVDLDAGLIRISHSVYPEPERSHGLSVPRLQDDSPADRSGVRTQYFDR